MFPPFVSNVDSIKAKQAQVSLLSSIYFAQIQYCDRLLVLYLSIYGSFGFVGYRKNRNLLVSLQ